MSIYLTGDTHGSRDLKKLAARRFDDTGLTRDDYMVVLGDFGLIWQPQPTDHEVFWLDWLEAKPWTTLVVLGNHENYDRFARMPQEPWHGGYVRRIRDNVLQLVDNGIFQIDGKSFFVRGGAHSIDRALRARGVSWWAEEVPSQSERRQAVKALDAVGWKVDYVLTHELPVSLVDALAPLADRPVFPDEYMQWLQGIANLLDFKRWFFGHYHVDYRDLGKFACVYQDVITLDGAVSVRCKPLQS